MWRRFTVLGGGLVAGALFAVLVTVVHSQPESSFEYKAELWATVMKGPAWYHGFGGRTPMVIFFGWLGMFLVPVHPISPKRSTGVLTAIGFVLWYFAGFLGVLVGLYGA